MMEELLETLVCTPPRSWVSLAYSADKLVGFFERTWNALSFSPVDYRISLAE